MGLKYFEVQMSAIKVIVNQANGLQASVTQAIDEKVGASTK